MTKFTDLFQKEDAHQQLMPKIDPLSPLIFFTIATPHTPNVDSMTSFDLLSVTLEVRRRESLSQPARVDALILSRGCPGTNGHSIRQT
ncbi:hypothetical protein AAMO2058_000033000 [Amorphochlora amoebiformis]